MRTEDRGQVSGTARGSLRPLFEPRAVAVVGAAREPGKVGHYIFLKLVEGGFSGPCYPVNPQAAEIAGVRAYAELTALPDRPDLAVIVLPSGLVPKAMRDCGEAGVPAAIVISAGFRESGPEGALLEREVARIAREYGVRFLGPNCLGLINTAHRLNASFAHVMPERGNISVLSQSGALLTAMLDWAQAEGVGFSKFVSLGNRADIGEADILRYLGEDPETRVVVAYLEGVDRGAEFLRVAAETAKRRPVIALKAGVTDAGARAASSHTGSLAGSKNAYRAAFRQSGVVQACSLEELFDLARAFSEQEPPKGRRVAILTNAGGPAVLASDACERAGIAPASFTRETLEALRGALPPAAGLYNPVDVLGDSGPDRFSAALRIVLSDPGVDALLVIVAPQAVTPLEEMAQALGAVLRNYAAKTVLSCFLGGSEMRRAAPILQRLGIPNYPFPERAVAALDGLLKHRELASRPADAPPAFRRDRAAAGRVLEKSRELGRRALSDIDAFKVIQAYGIPIPRGVLAHSPEEARDVASHLGFPVVLKVASPDILHKSDVGGIRTGLASKAEVERAYREIVIAAERYLPDAVLWGVSVQEEVPRTQEVIVGMNRDPQFGPLLMFGLGGIYVEILKDVSFRLAPIGPSQAREMMRDIRAFPLLRGARGRPESDIEAVMDCILRISQLCLDFPDIVEMEINPLMVKEKGKGVTAVDARIIVGEQP